MTQREVRLAELKKRIVALDDERTAIAAEIAALEQAQLLAMSFPNTVSLERVGHAVDRHSETDQKISLQGHVADVDARRDERYKAQEARLCD